MKHTATLTLFSTAALTACGFSQPESSASACGSINVTTSNVCNIRKGNPSNDLSILSKNYAGANSSKLIIGNFGFQGKKGLGTDTAFEWQVTLDACKDLPQGKNVLLTFNQYDAAGQLLISETATLPSVDAC